MQKMKDASTSKIRRKVPTCCKCGKKGQCSNSCHTQQKINKLLVNDSLKKQLSQILLTDESDEEKYYL